MPSTPFGEPHSKSTFGRKRSVRKQRRSDTIGNNVLSESTNCRGRAVLHLMQLYNSKNVLVAVGSAVRRMLETGFAKVESLGPWRDTNFSELHD